MQVCKTLVLYKRIAECQRAEGRSFSVSLSCPLFMYGCHFSSASPSPVHNFLVCAVFFSGDPKTCCHKKGRASLAQFALHEEGSFSSSPMLQLIWWKELCFLLTQTARLEMALTSPKCVSFTEVIQEILTREQLFGIVTHKRNNTFLSYVLLPWSFPLIQ